jgi:hypothetical protein
MRCALSYHLNIALAIKIRGDFGDMQKLFYREHPFPDLFPDREGEVS